MTGVHIKRALELSMRKQVLPLEQWTKYEEAKFYLEPYPERGYSGKKRERRIHHETIMQSKSVNVAALKYLYEVG